MKKKKRRYRAARKYKKRKKGIRQLFGILAAAVLLFFAGRYMAPSSWNIPWWMAMKVPQQVRIGGWQVPEKILEGLRTADAFFQRQTEGIRARWLELTGQNTGSMPLPESGELTVDFLDVGQGDCALIQVDGHAMLFDCGPEDRGTYVQNYLEKQNIETLDYVIGSHPDSDHIGGMDVVVSKFDCSMIFMPDVEKDSSSVRDVELALEYRGYDTVSPEPGQVYQLGDASYTILGPVWYYENDSNNNSIAIRLVYGSNSFLFTGDAEEEEEADMVANGLDMRADVYQAGHHGSNTASSWRLLTAVRPSYTVISCGAGNDYGHPHQEVLDRLETMGSIIYRTDQQGTVRVTSDGVNLSWRTER